MIRFEENINSIVSCPLCQGTGLYKNKICPQCLGYKKVLFDGKNYLYWGKYISSYLVNKIKIKNLVNNIFNLIFLTFGLGGFIILGFEFYNLATLNLEVWKFYENKNFLMLIFWFSVLADLFIFYRLQREYEKNKYIPKPKKTNKINNSLKKNKHLPGNKIDIAEYFNFESHQAITSAWQEAANQNCKNVLPLHLFITLMNFAQIQTIFFRLGIPFATLKSRIQNIIDSSPKDKKNPVFSEGIFDAIYTAYQNAYQFKQSKVDVVELFAALCSLDNEVNEILYDVGVTEDKINNIVAWQRINRQIKLNWQKFKKKAILRPKNSLNRTMTAVETPMLDYFSQDLTYLAQMGYLMPCVGREKEIETIFDILSGGPRRSILLTGFPGVGKNTIIEGIAQMMVEEEVPPFLQDKRLVSLSVTKLISGVSVNEAQGRLLRILHEIKRSGNIILFIGDIQNMIGISAGREGSMDLADVLSQALSSNSVVCLATTLPGDYSHYIENKSSVDNVFEKLIIEETTGDEAIRILEAKANMIEYHHNVFFSYDAIAKAVELSDRYLHDRFLPEKAIQILEESAEFTKHQKGKNAIVVANDIAALISQKTKIPLTEITTEESEKLLNLEDKIHERLVDQQEAVSMVATSIRRARAEMRDKKRPIANLLFLGPTGVGKTELAKAVAEVYFGAEENMIRLDMSEYQEKTSLSRLIGAPPGFASSDQGGFLTDAVRKNPFSLILLDEIEKSHPDILNVFLQILDDGRLTDSAGRVIDFTETIIIATSNAGSLLIESLVAQNIPIAEIRQKLIDQELNKYFKPEFLNRFDGIIVFKPLTIIAVKKIAVLMINKIAATLEDRGINLQYTEAGLEFLANAGFDQKFGARPLRRVIQETVQDQLANLIITHGLARRDTVVIEDQGKLSIIKANKLN